MISSALPRLSAPRAARIAWAQAQADPLFQDVPYKVETNRTGQLVLSPHKNTHSILQFKIGRLLDIHGPAGKVGVEFAVQTPEGIKVPDVVWMSEERWQLRGGDDPSPVIPEICVEVLSEGNTAAEMAEKRALLLGLGAVEVWLCDADGALTFYGPDGRLDHSHLVPDAPVHVTL